MIQSQLLVIYHLHIIALLQNDIIRWSDSPHSKAMAGAESSPPLAPKPISALPSHLANGASALHPSPALRERESLTSSIRSSFRQAVNLDGATDLGQSLHGEAGTNGTDSHREITARYL